MTNQCEPMRNNSITDKQRRMKAKQGTAWETHATQSLQCTHMQHMRTMTNQTNQTQINIHTHANPLNTMETNKNKHNTCAHMQTKGDQCNAELNSKGHTRATETNPGTPMATPAMQIEHTHQDNPRAYQCKPIQNNNEPMPMHANKFKQRQARGNTCSTCHINSHTYNTTYANTNQGNTCKPMQTHDSQ